MSINEYRNIIIEYKNEGNSNKKRNIKDKTINAIEVEIKNNLNSILHENQDKDGRILIDKAEKTAILLYFEDISTSQLRKIYDRVKRFEIKESSSFVELNLIKAQIAYAAGREKKLRRFYNIIEQLISETNDKSKLKRFKNFFEAVVAYNRFYTEKE